MSVKKPINLLLVNIYYISAIGFYQNLRWPNTIAFITSLYKINQIIKDKEALAYNQLSRESKLINKEQQNRNYSANTRNLRMYSLRQYLICSRRTNYTTIRLRLSQIKKIPLAIAPSASNLLISYRLLSSILLITLIRALLSLAKSPLPYLFSL